MRVLLVKASAQNDFKNYKVKIELPCQSIYNIANKIRNKAHVQIIDETVGQRVDYRVKADLIGIFFSTPNAIRAYELSSNFQEIGKSVFLGGIHVNFRPEEALRYTNSIIKGDEIETILDLINDFKNGKLKRIYQEKSVLNSRYDKKCLYKYNLFILNKFLKEDSYKAVKQVIEEIKNSKTTYFELDGINCFSNKTWAQKLFKELITLNINWSISSDISISEDEKLLDLAVRSGLSHLLIDLNIPLKEFLGRNSDYFIKIDELKRKIKKLQQYGIIIDSTIMFGFDEHDKTIFKKSLEFVLDLGVDICKPLIQVPLPGTKLFDNLEKEKRILTYDWSLYDGKNVIYKPKLLSENDIYLGVKNFYEKFNSIKNTKQKETSEILV